MIDARLVTLVSNWKHLTFLEISNAAKITATGIQHALQQCPSLKGLTFDRLSLDKDKLDNLLIYGEHLELDFATFPISSQI